MVYHSLQTTGSVLQTLSNILEAPAEILMNAHNLGSSTTRYYLNNMATDK